jgi:hypothetical protein
MHALTVAAMPDCQDETACHSQLGIAIPGPFPNPGTGVNGIPERNGHVIKDSNPADPLFQSRDFSKAGITSQDSRPL